MLLNFFTKNKSLFIVIAIFLIGLIIRLIWFHIFAWIDFDQGRELLVARHIAHFQEFLTIGHDSSFVPGLYYPPYYYYFLALLSFIKDDLYSIYFFFFLLQFISLYLFFLAAKNLFNYKIATYSLLLYTFFPLAIQTTNFWGFHVGLSFFIISFYFFSLFFKKHRFLYLFFHVLFLGFSSFIGYEFLYLVPYFFFWSLYILFTAKKGKEYFLKFIVIWFFPLIVILVSLLPLIGTKLLEPSFVEMHIPTILYNSISHFYQFIGSIYSLPIKNVNVLFTISHLLLIGLAFYLIKIKIRDKAKLSLLLILFLYTFSISGIKKGGIEQLYISQYFIALYPLYFLLISAIIFYVLRTLVFFKLLIFIIILSGILNLNFYSSLFSSNRDEISNSLVQTDALTQMIAKEIESCSRDLGRFCKFDVIKHSAKWGKYETPEIYYLLEKKLNKKLVQIVNIDRSYNNFIKLEDNQQNDLQFLICLDYTDVNLSNCTDSFTDNKSSYKMISVSNARVVYEIRDHTQ